VGVLRWGKEVISTALVHKSSTRKEKIITGGAIYVLLSIFGIFFFLPFVWMIFTSLKMPAQIFALPIRWFPWPIHWQNFPTMWKLTSMQVPFANSVIITFGSMAGVFLSAPVVAYGFARINFWGKDLLFIVLLGTIMLPIQITIVPLYIIYRYLGWINTFKPFIVPSFFGGGAFFIFLLRQFFMTIPSELEDAARIDGCSTFGILWRIFLPLSKPVIAAVGIFDFVNTWNEYFLPLILLTSAEKIPLTVALALFRDVEGSLQYNMVMAAAIVATVPCIVIFLVAQKYFVQGIAITGIKE